MTVHIQGVHMEKAKEKYPLYESIREKVGVCAIRRTNETCATDTPCGGDIVIVTTRSHAPSGSSSWDEPAGSPGRKLPTILKRECYCEGCGVLLRPQHFLK